MLFYNPGVNIQAPSPLHAPSPQRRWLTLWLAAWLSLLLAMGPFLHGHFGVSHETGFHMDGVHTAHPLPPADTFAVAKLSANDEESLALGVATSLPHSDEDLPLPALALLLAVLPLLPPRLQPLSRPERRRHPQGTLYRAGLPPPGLAPPAT